MSRRLKRNFFARKPEVVAKELLGKILVRKVGKRVLSGRIVEVEAYLNGDEAAHSFTGISKRNQSLYKGGGHLYVHTQRHHTLMDIVTDKEGIPGSVLIRALEPIEGLDLMRQKRGRENPHELMNGPGKICEALDISLALDGIDTTTPKAEVYIEEAPPISKRQVGVSHRIGITKAATKLLRFYLLGNPYVSRFRGINPVGAV